MPDNTQLNTGTGGDLIATDELTTLNGSPSSGVKVQRVKVGFGPDNSLRDVDSSNGLPMYSVPPPFMRVGFAEVGAGLVGLAATELTLIQTGAGMAVNQSAGNLVITTGTTANSETVIRSVGVFSGSLLARYKTILSQRIANNTFRFELADLIGTGLSYTINSATSVTVTFPTANPFSSVNVGQSVRLSVITGAAGIPGRYAIASVSGLTVTFTVAAWPATGSGTLSLYGWNYIASEYSGTVATNSSFDAQRRGWNSGNTTATINTTASPGHVGQIAFDVHTAGFGDALVASNTGYQWTQRASRIENIPDEDVNLYLFIVVQNGSTAPASTTTLTVGFVQVEDQGRQKVRIASSDPTGSHALPTQVMNTVPVSGTVTSTVTGYPTAAASADALANPTVTQLAALGLQFNGTTWDRERNNHNVAIEASSAKTTTGNGATQTNFNAVGVFVWINVTAVTGTTPTLTVRLQWSPDGGTTWVDLDTTNAQTASITATGASVLRVYPGMATTANASLNSPLPRTWRIAWTIGGTTPSFTFSAQAAYID
jgi:hypothetical protein